MDTENPLKTLRVRLNLTQAKLADELDCSKQFIIRAEQGCYVDPPESLVEFFCSELEIGAYEIQQGYYAFQHETRVGSYGKLIEPWQFVSDKHPFTYWREASGVSSEAAACVLFCLHPAVMFKFERGKMESVPEQLVVGLLESGYSGETLDLLETKYREFKVRTREVLEVTLSDTHREAV